MTVEILQPGAGDDRNKDVEVEKLYSMLVAPSADDPFELRPGIGEMAPIGSNRFGYNGLRRVVVDWRAMAAPSLN